jgi:hypothetical protein
MYRDEQILVQRTGIYRFDSDQEDERSAARQLPDQISEREYHCASPLISSLVPDLDANDVEPGSTSWRRIGAHLTGVVPQCTVGVIGKKTGVQVILDTRSHIVLAAKNEHARADPSAGWHPS